MIVVVVVVVVVDVASVVGFPLLPSYLAPRVILLFVIVLLNHDGYFAPPGRVVRTVALVDQGILFCRSPCIERRKRREL